MTALKQIGRLGGILLLAAALAAALADRAAAARPADTAPATQPEMPDTATVPADMETARGPGYAVSRLHEALLEAMKNAERLGYQGRFDMLQPVIASLFDTPLICKVILSRYWGDLSDSQKGDFIELFNRLSTATYASRFDSYSGEEFRETGVEELRKGRQLVKTELVRRDKDPVQLDYLVHQEDGQWRIISVIADGVNDLSLKRAEYAAVIKDKGYDGLVKDIQSKIKDMESGS